MQILSGILLEAQGSELRLAATDMELSLRATLAAQIEGDGSIVLPGKTFADIARLLPAGEVLIEHKPAESVVHVTAGTASYTLHTFNPEDFPRLQELDSVQTFTVDRESLLETIHRVARAASRASVSVTFSVPTLDHEIWQRTEPATAPPRQRLRALKQLVDAGIEANVGMAPILPGLSDKPELMADVVRAAREAGATGVWANLLYLKPGTKEHFLSALERDWPELLPEYDQLFGRRAYLPKSDSEPVRTSVRELTRMYGIRDRRRVKLAPPPDPEQLRLAI